MCRRRAALPPRCRARDRCTTRWVSAAASSSSSSAARLSAVCSPRLSAPLCALCQRCPARPCPRPARGSCCRITPSRRRSALCSPPITVTGDVRGLRRRGRGCGARLGTGRGCAGCWAPPGCVAAGTARTAGLQSAPQLRIPATERIPATGRIPTGRIPSPLVPAQIPFVTVLVHNPAVLHAVSMGRTPPSDTPLRGAHPSPAPPAPPAADRPSPQLLTLPTTSRR